MPGLRQRRHAVTMRAEHGSPGVASLHLNSLEDAARSHQTRACHPGKRRSEITRGSTLMKATAYARTAASSLSASLTAQAASAAVTRFPDRHPAGKVIGYWRLTDGISRQTQIMGCCWLDIDAMMSILAVPCLEAMAVFVRAKKSGTRRYLQVVENRWEDGAVRQRGIATFGCLDPLQTQGDIGGPMRSLGRFADRVCVVGDAASGLR